MPCLKLRQIILQTFPDTKEVCKRGVPSYAGDKVFIRTMKNQVLLGFSVTGMQARQSALFPGRGKEIRIMKIKSNADINEKKIIKLLKIAASCSDDN